MNASITRKHSSRMCTAHLLTRRGVPSWNSLHSTPFMAPPFMEPPFVAPPSQNPPFMEPPSQHPPFMAPSLHGTLPSWHPPFMAPSLHGTPFHGTPFYGTSFHSILLSQNSPSWHPILQKPLSQHPLHLTHPLWTAPLPPPAVNRMNHRCKNITLPQTLRAVTNASEIHPTSVTSKQ